MLFRSPATARTVEAVWRIESARLVGALARTVHDVGLAEDLGIHGAALIVRSGGGRSGETFALEGGPTTIGRSPECGIFLDDVTVSRKHAVFTKDGDRWHLEDQGSLNGTFVNRERVENADLRDGDELQIGKYRLTFLQR